MSNKEIVIDLLSRLPDETSLEEIARQIELLAGVRTAREQAHRREGIPAGEARKKLSPLDAERYLSEHVERGKKVDIDAIMAKIPIVKPKPQDRLAG